MNVLRWLLLLVLIPGVLLAQSNTDPQLTTTVEAVPAQIAAVASGGYWTRDGHDGSFRVLIESVGWDELSSRVFLQWLRNDPDKQVQVIERTVPIKEIAGKWRVVSQKFVLRGKRWDIVVSAERRVPKAAATFAITPTADYSYTIATSEK